MAIDTIDNARRAHDEAELRRRIPSARRAAAALVLALCADGDPAAAPVAAAAQEALREIGLLWESAARVVEP